MENNIKHYHKELQKYIRIVEDDETNKEALDKVKEMFLATFNMIKLIMISRQERYYGLFLMNFDLKIDFTTYYAAGVSIDSFPFRMTVNPLLVGLKTLPEMIYIFCHEIEHIVLNHPVDGILYKTDKPHFVGNVLRLREAVAQKRKERYACVFYFSASPKARIALGSKSGYLKA